eukprot:TRINITY_DN24601_c0_g1_i1.p2 TRINITY_DN24601_c0_g1~~TRINITY_DN24601_c0_g1_i1.p2  ORF type:complete len:208 (-),score=30.97 TRINITY_DN24601_c0_g1_i1:86-709(-)
MSLRVIWCGWLTLMGVSYGDMPAHDYLWQGCYTSKHDIGARMVIVPMSQEARGLDAGPKLVKKLQGFGDNRSAGIVQRISDEEKAHVAVGVFWFRALCSAFEIDPAETYRQWILKLCPDLLKGYYDHSSRQEVGLEQTWYDLERWPEIEQKLEVENVLQQKIGRDKRYKLQDIGQVQKMDSEHFKLQQLKFRLCELLELEMGNVALS